MSKGNSQRRQANGRKNPVARVMNTYCKPATMRDRTKYRRERITARDWS